MPPPSHEHVVIATGALRAEAGIWRRLSDELHTIAGKARSLDMTRIETGIFQAIAGPYDQAITQIADRCRSEEHTSELQSQSNLVCRLLLEKKKKKTLIVSLC